MSLHRITAGSGYDYLTRQVAAMDSTEKGHTGLASYYLERGETPGQWMGSGLVGLDGLEAGDVVTAEQMQALFGAGHHPLAEQILETLATSGMSKAEMIKLTQLGKPYLVYEDDISDFRIEVARRLELLNKERGLPRSAKVAIEDRATIRTQVAREMFSAEFGRPPADERELAGHVAKLSRQKTTAVAGFDLTFSPVKSVSTLWALADPHTAARIEQAHNRAVADALRFIETHALYTRTGAGGARQVDVQGLVAAAFTHRDSRAGDPDLHTHVAVANRVQTLDGRWLAIDGRVLYKATVAASETYNTALEAHLGRDLGLQFEVRTNTDPRKRPIREVVGVDAALNERWSSRRAAIEARRSELVAQFQAAHHRPPTPTEAIALAQQANLETRQAKHEPRTVTEQRTEWRRQAEQALGSPDAVTNMVRGAVGHRPSSRAAARDAQWIEQAAAAVVDHVQQGRSVWQVWHIRAEALRAARSAEISVDALDTVVDQLVSTALHHHSVQLQRGGDGVTEPEVLRRSDGASVYDVAGVQLYTSSAIMRAEQRLVTAAATRDGLVIDGTAVDLALLETQANGVQLNAGQALLVREMATSGARLQLAIAPAGSGKTTAMNALSAAWCEGGGNVVGLAPSAAAAAALGGQLRGDTDTLAKLIWDLNHNQTASWDKRIGPRTLLVIDEAGMADTLSLDTAVQYALSRGASIRLIGDDQQLAAVGAGGVLRDIQATHGALRLAELLRFSDSAEAAASLALRQGHLESLGFYLDRGRVLVGDQVTMADDLYAAWAADRAGGLDSIMLGPTRELVASLNARARTDRLSGTTPQRQVELSDGNQASAGDTIITRLNNRQLRLSSTDFVKNGDRFEVLEVQADGSITAQHLGNQRAVTLPADYVAAQVELGYACTTHTAQGVTADTMHGLLSGDESRQQAYTMLTRGRHSNTAYVVVVGDGDAHNAIRPETINPLTPTDILERVLAKDESPISATTSLRQATDPRHLLGQATLRYADALAFAVEHQAGPAGLRALERAVDDALPRLTDAANWPALRSQLLLTRAAGRDPIDALAQACAQPLTGAHDPASVLAWRVADQRREAGPLPWLSDVPAALSTDPIWGNYLAARRDLVADLATQVRTQTLAEAHMPEWVGGITGRPPAELIADVEVWRAANQIPSADPRPTGEPVTGMAATRHQRHLSQRLADTQTVAIAEWRALLNQVRPHLADDPFAPRLAHRLSQISSGGLDAAALVHDAADDGPLPDDHAAAALWWRIAGRLTPAATGDVDQDHHSTSAWLDQFSARIGADTSALVQASGWWPALSSAVERGLQRGWQLDTLLDEVAGIEPDGHADLCQAWVWRLSLFTDQLPIEDFAEDLVGAEFPRPVDIDDVLQEWQPATVTDMVAQPLEPLAVEPEHTEALDVSDDDQLALEALVRATLPVPEPTDADIRRQMDHRDQIATSPVPPQRLLEINELAAEFYQSNLPGSWAEPYLESRFRTDADELPRVRPGYAPAEWRSLLQHLSRHNVSADEAIAAGLAKQNENGKVYDRFRDRVVFPVIHNDQVLGFVGRRNPDFAGDETYNPKYYNSPDTPVFHKGEQLFVAGVLDGDAVPVLVEGPMDAIATTVASGGRMVGVAPLGTSLTEQQVAQLHASGVTPVVATDADLAGRVAADRDYWLLAPYGLAATHAALPEGSDPASMVEAGQADHLVAAIEAARPLAETLVDERLANITDSPEAVLAAAQVLAAQPAEDWTSGAEHIAERTGVPSNLVRAALLSYVRSWNADPRNAAQQGAWQVNQVKERLAARRAEQRRKENPETVQADTAGPEPKPDTPPAQRGIDR